jgi:beta-glucanase (GH16 family)
MRKNNVVTIVIASMGLILLFCKNPSKPAETSKPLNGWTLTWSDEFNGTGEPDSRKWDRPEYNRRNNDAGPDGWWLKEDSFLDGRGNLVLRAKKINNRNADNDAFDYSTGAVRSYGRFEQRYGKFEIRCHLPTQPGWWVAFWLMSEGVGNEDGSGEDGTEIDIMEGFGWTDKINHALHWDGYGDAHKSQGKMFAVPGIRRGFHTFALEWSDSLYVFFVDSVESWRSTAGGVSKVPAYVKITAELSTEAWAINEYWSNDPKRAVFPDSFFVDYVRVYKRP